MPRRGFACALILALAACGPGEPDPPVNPGVCGEHEIDPLGVGFKKLSASERFELEVVDAVPLEPGEGFNNWDLRVVDQPAALQLPPDLVITLQPYMPDHDHGPAATAATFDDEALVYATGDMDLFMPGYWEITATLGDDGGSTLDTAVFALCVE